jgi:HTH-type transcriptional repressor of NAD biosynthesis genes
MEKKSDQIRNSMKHGLIIGKFLPLHTGHLSLIDYGLQNCNHLTVVLCYHPQEPISGAQRLLWLQQSLRNYHNISLISYSYDPTELSDNSNYHPKAATAWAVVLKELVPHCHVIFTSEAYGEHVAKEMEIEHCLYDLRRNAFPVSGSDIRQSPISYWNYLPPAVRPFYVKKVCLSGSESTGKSTLAIRLAEHFHSIYVPEKARDILGHTNDCTPEHLVQIAEAQASAINSALMDAHKVLICDTDLNITRSYARFLFNKELNVSSWVEEANDFALHLFLETDCPYIQDGTRLSLKDREALSVSHKAVLQSRNLPFISIRGNWEERFQQCCKYIHALLK